MLSGFFVTKKGKNLLAKTHDGANIELTRAEIGSGDIPEGQLVTEVTSLYGKVKELPLGEVKVGSGKEVCIPVQLTNKGVLTSFLFKEIGVYAIDPDEGEILYLYGNTDVTGDVPDEVKSESESQVDYLFNLLLNIDNTTKVDVNVDNSLIYATLQNLSDMADTKVDKVSGKGLSTEDYTTAEKNKLAGIAAGANKYVHPSTHPVGMITGLGTAATENTGTSSGNVPVIESNGKLPAVIIPSDDGKQDKLTFDTSPKSGSTNPVTSAGIYTALAGKANREHNQGHDTITFNPEANKERDVFLLDRGYVDVAGACRTAFMPADAITVEYTQDNGVTWNSYNLTDTEKKNLFSMNRSFFIKLGGPNATAQTIGHGVRITVEPVDRYTNVDTFYCWFSSASSSTKCSIERSTIEAKNTFTTIRSNVPVSGSAGSNMITFPEGRFGGDTSQTSNGYAYRFTFITTTIDTTTTTASMVTDLRLYGSKVWAIPNQMMFNGHLYSWDANQNATFPAQLNAAGGTLTGELVPNGGLAHAGTDGYIAYPDGGQYVSSISSVTGMLKIALPVSWTSTMLKFKVSIYNYKDNTSVDYILAGYNYRAEYGWSRTTAYCVSPWGQEVSNLPVSFGHDGTKCAITIGTPTTVWSYPQVVISDVTVAFEHTKYDMWKSGWSLSFVTEVLPTVNATISNTNITYNLDANNLRAGLVPPERLSPDPGVYTVSPQLGPSDVLHSSLDNPTLAEIGAVDSTFTNKIAFYPYENALCEISSDGGTTWTPDPNMTETKWKKLVSENNELNNTTFSANVQYRITFSSNRYCYLNAVYFYASMPASTKIGVKIERYNESDSEWSILTPQTNALTARPDHFWLQHARTAFNPTLESKAYFSKVRITFIPAGNVEASSTIDLRGLRWYGTFPGTDHRTIYSWDEDKNVTFPAQLKASEVYDNNQRVYSPVNKPSAEDLGAATSSHTHNLATTAESGYMSGADKTKVEATNVAYGTCSTAAATAAKVVTLSGNTNWKLVPGSMVVVKFTYTNTATNPTLNVNGTGAKSIWVNTAVITTSNLTYAGIASRPIKFVYDGTYYVVMGWSGDDNSTYALMTAAEATTGTATNAKLISAKVLHDKIEEMLSESLSGSGTGQTWHAKDILGSGTTSTADATAESGYSVTIDTTAKNIDGSAKKYKAPFGTYVAIFRVQASTVTGSADKIKLEIWGASAAIASRAVKLSDFSAASKWEYFKIPFETDSTSGRDIYPKVTCLNATGNVKVDNIVVVPNAFALM